MSWAFDVSLAVGHQKGVHVSYVERQLCWDSTAGLLGHATWHFLIDADGVLTVVSFDHKNSVPAFQSSGYQCVDRLVKLSSFLQGSSTVMISSERRRGQSGKWLPPFTGMAVLAGKGYETWTQLLLHGAAGASIT